MDQTPSQHEAVEVVGEALAAIRGSSIAELEVEWDGGSVRIHREPTHVVAPTEITELTTPADDRVVVRSQHVGIFHGGTGGPFPKAGAWVGTGTRLGAIETLGILNGVLAPTDGRIDEVLTEDGMPVEYGQLLVVMRPEPMPTPTPLADDDTEVEAPREPDG